MAGAQMDDEENPIAVNVVPLIDIIFCLCVFFMCSFRFKQLEGKFESWLPKDRGTGGVAEITNIVKPETRVVLLWDAANQKTRRQVGVRPVNDDVELQQYIRDMRADLIKLNHDDAPVTIDADERVPMADVIAVVNLCKREGIDNIEFALSLQKVP
jgi:biopolymer transport protein ExbD